MAIHGLHGDSFSTWLPDRSKRYTWLEEFLPIAMPKARIFVYGYNADVFSFTDGRAKDAIQDAAQNLLEALRKQREEVGSRQEMFICHSMGGLIVKQASILLI